MREQQPRDNDVSIDAENAYVTVRVSAYAPRRAHACKREARAIECRRGRGRAGSGGGGGEEEEEEGESDRERTDRFVQ